MAVKRITTQSFGSRLGKSISGILGGAALFLVSIVLLFWNEGRAVKTARGLAEGESSVVSLENTSKVDSATRGALVHLTGLAESGEQLRDEAFSIEVPALKLRRTVEMLQWREIAESKTRTKLGGGTETETTYSHEKIWSDALIDSSRFEVPDPHRNPSAKGLESREVEASDIRIGAYHLGEGLINRLNRYVEISPQADLPEGHITQGNVIFRSADPNAPQIGDLRISFKAAMSDTVSVIAQNNNGLLEGYKTGNGTVIQFLEYGEKSANEMFQAAKSANKTLTFGLRIVGLLLLFIGIKSVLGPITVVADVLPWIGRVSRAGTSLISVVIALPVGLITIAIAWITYRPIIGIGIIVVAIVATAAIIKFASKPGKTATA